MFPIDLPGLDQRPDDIPLLAELFLTQLNLEAGTPKQLGAGALQALARRSWPGNVRELKNVLQRAYILSDNDIIDAEQLSLPRNLTAAGLAIVKGKKLIIPIGTTPIEVAKRELIYATLNHYSNNKTRTAAALKISLKTLYNRLRDYDSGFSDTGY